MRDLKWRWDVSLGVCDRGAQAREEHLGVSDPAELALPSSLPLCGRLAGGFLAGCRLGFCQRLNAWFITLLSLTSSHFGWALALLATSVA